MKEKARNGRGKDNTKCSEFTAPLLPPSWSYGAHLWLMAERRVSLHYRDRLPDGLFSPAMLASESWSGADTGLALSSSVLVSSSVLA